LLCDRRVGLLSGNPFDNSQAFEFPPPEGRTKFAPFDRVNTHLLIAQAQLPPTELVEVAGFTGTAGTIGPEFDAFDDGKGATVPPPDGTGSRNEPIRLAVMERLNASAPYRTLFGEVFPEVRAGGRIDAGMFGHAIAEFEFTLTFANAPVDRFARGDPSAMSAPQKRGALIFFAKAKCVQCHAVSGPANEMFSDFENHVVGVPQIAPAFGIGKGNVIFDGPGRDEDFGMEQVTGNPADRYRFRTAPLRNAALQAAFFHNGAFRRLEDAIAHHLDVFASARRYRPQAAGGDRDLADHLGPIEPVLQRIDPVLAQPLRLDAGEFQDLVAFVRDGLLDERVSRRNLCKLAPDSVPSGAPVIRFEACAQ